MRLPALLAGLVLASCQQSPAVPASRVHPTIVSLNPCSDAVLAEVADKRQVLGLSHYSMDPASSSMNVDVARRYRSVGDSAEEVLALRPDVVVASSYLAPATVEALRATGVRLVQLPIAHTIAQSHAQVRELALLAGHQDRGDALIARLDAALRAAAPPPGQRWPTALVWQSGGIVAGRDTLIADLLAHTGFADAGAARGLRQADLLPLEAMLADPPDVILVAGNPQAQEDRMLAHPALSALTQTRVARLDPSLLWCGGPTIARSAAWLSRVRRAS